MTPDLRLCAARWAPDYRDLTIEAFAYQEAALWADLSAARERIVDLEYEVEGFRLFAFEAVAYGRKLMLERDDYQARYHRLLDESRAFRASVMKRLVA